MSCGTGEYVRLMENYPLVTGASPLPAGQGSDEHQHPPLPAAPGTSGGLAFLRAGASQEP